MAETPDIDPELHRSIAITTNGRAWQLIEQDDLSAAERDELLDVAHASAYHWKVAGTALHELRAQWLITRANAELGNGPAALRHASRCFELTKAAGNEAQDFDRAYAAEAMARAHAICGESEQADEHYLAAQQIIAAIDSEGDRELAAQDLSSGNWGTYRRPAQNS